MMWDERAVVRAAGGNVCSSSAFAYGLATNNLYVFDIWHICQTDSLFYGVSSVSIEYFCVLLCSICI